VTYLLDSNAVITLMKGHDGFLTRIRQHHPRDFAISSIVMHELFYGAYRGQRTTENLVRIESLRFEVLAFDREDARHAGEVGAMLAAAGTLVGPYDVLIAGQAIARDLTLITHNVRDFQRVPALKVEDWDT
jgi:tRNA(fMet)-specific endonuclease VapC